MCRVVCIYALCAGLIAASFDCDDAWLPSQPGEFSTGDSLAGSSNAADAEEMSIEPVSHSRGFLSRESQGRWSAASRVKSIARAVQLARAGLRRPFTRDLPDVLSMRLAGASLPALHVRLQI